MSILLYGAAFAVVSAGILQQVCRTVPEPFIDEIFHIPQTQQYCNGTFDKWNGKITTPPGLYFLALVLQFPVKVLNGEAFCRVPSLRAVNVVFNTISMYFFYMIFKEIHKSTRNESERTSTAIPLLKLQSLSLAIFPLNYFFSFLYYTDPGSTMFVVAAYLANVKSMHKTSAFLGLLSVFFRQTNIVWVLFFAGCTAAKEMEKAKSIKEIEASPDIKDKLVRFLVGIVAAAVKYLLVIGNIFQIFKLVWPYVCVLFGFAGFLAINGGIVLGDKQNHEPTFHAPQILYFFAFTMLFSAPILVSFDDIKKFLAGLTSNPLKFAVFASIFAFMIIKYTHIHIFVLSDNRHYTFYLCRYVLKHFAFRILLIPVYIYAGWAINNALQKPSCSGIWKLVFLLCTCAVTIPQRLIEFRYFIVPYIIFRLNVRVERQLTVLLEFLLYFAINAFTLFVFFGKEVKWENIPEPQRIIW